MIRDCGLRAMAFTFLTVTPFEDQMIITAGKLILISLFYISIFVLMS